MSDLISIRAYARRRGCSHVAVLKAAREGRITLVDGQVDPDAADRQWAANTLPQVGRDLGDAGSTGTPGGAEPGHSDEYLAVLEYLYGCADRLAPLLVRVQTPKRMRELLREVMSGVCDEFERVGLL